MSIIVGDAVYENGGIAVTISHNEKSADAHIQVTVYQIVGPGQKELIVLSKSVQLDKGDNRIRLPALLGPGKYKLYIYVIRNGERKTAVIRDIVV
jgi:hypothetical protein